MCFTKKSDLKRDIQSNFFLIIPHKKHKHIHQNQIIICKRYRPQLDIPILGLEKEYT